MKAPGRGWTVWLTSVFIRHNWQLIFANLSSIGTTHVAFTSLRKATSPHTVDSVEYWYHYIHSIKAIWAQMRFSPTFIGTDYMTKESLLHRHSSIHSQLIDGDNLNKLMRTLLEYLGRQICFTDSDAPALFWNLTKNWIRLHCISCLIP